MPAAAIKRFQGGLTGVLLAKKRRHQGLAPGAKLAHGQALRGLLVVDLAHPVGFDDRLWQHDQMVARTEALTAAKVGGALARTVLFEHRIDTPFTQRAQQKIRGVERITQQQVSALQGIENRTQQRLFIAAIAPIMADRRIEQRPAAQAHKPQHPTQREAQSGFLAAWLRVSGLIVGRVRHPQRRAIHQAHRVALPVPGIGCVRRHPPPHVSGKRIHHLHRQAHARTAVCPGRFELAFE